MGRVAIGVRLFCLAVAGALGAGACTGDDTESSPVEILCETDCRLWADCTGQYAADQRRCYQSCTSATWTLRGEVIEHYTACLDRLGCESLEQSLRDVCFDGAFESATPSTACAHYCEVGTQKAFECGYRYSVEACVDGNCGVVDALLDDAAQCHDVDDCEDWDLCLRDAFRVQ